jgi:rsbT co-antagonist protein RsbR
MVALLLIGMLDCARTQIVVESLLKEIVTSGAEIPISGVPTVDTLVTQHLISRPAGGLGLGLRGAKRLSNEFQSNLRPATGRPSR